MNLTWLGFDLGAVEGDYTSYFRLVDKTVVPANPDLSFYREFDIANRRVAISRFRVWQYRRARKGGYRKDPKRISVVVSTVFLGFDHGCDRTRPVLFETMVFFKGRAGRRSPHEQACCRYSTWEEAENGHRVVCEEVKRLHIKR